VISGKNHARGTLKGYDGHSARWITWHSTIKSSRATVLHFGRRRMFPAAFRGNRESVQPASRSKKSCWNERDVPRAGRCLNCAGQRTPGIPDTPPGNQPVYVRPRRRPAGRGNRNARRQGVRPAPTPTAEGRLQSCRRCAGPHVWRRRAALQPPDSRNWPVQGGNQTTAPANPPATKGTAATKSTAPPVQPGADRSYSGERILLTNQRESRISRIASG